MDMLKHDKERNKLVLVWYHFFDTIRMSIMRISLFLMPVGSIYHARTLGKIVLVSLENGIDPNNNTGTHSFSHFDIPTKYHYLTRIKILVPAGRFFNTIINVDC
jgi:hypothetical protein